MAKKITGKRLLKSKTFWAALATIAGGVSMFVSGEQQLQELLVSSIGAVFLVLRTITAEPITSM